jgi:Cytochrome P450
LQHSGFGICRDLPCTGDWMALHNLQWTSKGCAALPICTDQWNDRQKLARIHYYWHGNAEEFDPDRWTKDFKSSLPRFSYFPFGGGIRSCVGEPFAWIEGILVLATICRKWKMQHDPSHIVELKPLITLRPKYGMRMKLTRRRTTTV